MENFESVADTMIAAMEKHALSLRVRGVIVVGMMDEPGTSWVTRMKSVGKIKDVAEHPEQQEYPGHNYIAIAYSKAAEMADTKLNSGSGVRPVYQGEFGYPGGAILKVRSGYVVAVFSGATGEQDFEIANAGLNSHHFER
jgi:hypothetical protein